MKIRSVNLNWEPLEVHYRSSGIALLRVLVKEEQMELRVKLPGCVRTLDRLLATGHTVYLHCTAGVGRSPTIAVAYLHWFLGCRFGSPRADKEGRELIVAARAEVQIAVERSFA